MPRQRRAYSAKRSRRTSRAIHDSTIGTHVARRPSVDRQRHGNAYAAAMVRRARMRRIAVAIAVVVVVVALAIGAGVMAFRGAVGGSLTLEDSDAPGALVAVKSGEPSYVLISAELGAVAEPLDNGGPDVFLLARLDSANRALALVSIPSALQITTDNRSDSVSAVAAAGDAALIDAVSTFAKVDISHFVKLASADDVVGFVDALGGISVNVPQAIDDPHAGTICIPEGTQVLDGEAALTFLRADNLEYGAVDRLNNQLSFAAAAIGQLFSPEGSFDRRLDSAGPFIQTDLSLADLESMSSWLGELGADDITKAVLPGYFMAVTDASSPSSGPQRYISTSSEVAELVDDLENGRTPSSGAADQADTVKPSSFTVEIQNGTTVEGAAATAADVLKAAGFKVGDVGNAEQPIYEETLVIYKDADGKGPSRAKTVIDALGAGRAVDGEAYYTFDSDVLLIIGADNKPAS